MQLPPIRFNRKAFSVVLLCAAIICIVAAVASFARTEKFVASAARASAQIVELLPQKDKTGASSGAPAYFTVFRFSDSGGTIHTVHSKAATAAPPGKVGQTINVLYHPETPGDARVDGLLALWTVPLIAGGLAVLYLAAGLLIWFWPRIKLRSKRAAGEAAHEE